MWRPKLGGGLNFTTQTLYHWGSDIVWRPKLGGGLNFTTQTLYHWGSDIVRDKKAHPHRISDLRSLAGVSENLIDGGCYIIFATFCFGMCHAGDTPVDVICGDPLGHRGL